MGLDHDHIRAWVPYAGFLVFGAFWGVWGASVPVIRAQAGLTDGQLGTALLFIAAGALPAMPLAGRAVDRWGRRATAITLTALGLAGVAVAVTARDLPALCVGLAVLGAASGAADVTINAAAGSAERATGRPVITRAHGFFSVAVVVASLLTGLLNAVGLPVVVPYLLVALAAATVSAAIAGSANATVRATNGTAGSADATGSADIGAGDRTRADSGRRQRARASAAPGRPGLRAHLPLLLVAGGLGALGFAVENAHQSWSAVYLADTVHAGPALVGAGPAVFALSVALTRFAIGAVRTRRAWLVLTAGAALAAAATSLLALASSLPLALLGLALAAAGTAVLFPTVLGLATANVPAAARGAATSVVSTSAYLGFLAGPVYVGHWAQAAGLPGAMLAVAALAAALALLAWPALRAVDAAGTGRATGGAPEASGRPRPSTSPSRERL
ncbi:MFS transporter [Nonomuraea roseoviolacea]|uniref:MFS family permease n=1 Tax=Nonomuraea roseoviolacea subsp. carminata TaxID=160689 RepID=A0ABT1KFZ8_9ACTN|nr:MFS transporter [Nonomuraea roseoviolacea]MCP2352938.1 MFS family permease [Nonomuraea roseoviolacea subsp. carminata]